MKRVCEHIRGFLTSSFRRKALWIALPGLLVASVVYTFEAVTTERMIVRDEIRHKAEVVAQLASRIGELPLLSENAELMRMAMGQLRAVHGVTFVAFYNRDMKLLEKDVEEGLSTPQSPPADLKIFISEAAKYFDVYAPVIINRAKDDISMFYDTQDALVGEGAGWVRIGFSKADMVERERAILIRGVGIATISTLTIGGLIFLMFTIATKPLDAISRALRGMRSGQYQELQVSSRDEIGMLAAEFNKMADAVRDREIKLRESEKRIRTLFDRVEHAIFRINRDGRIIQSNPKFLELCGSALHFGSLLNELPQEERRGRPAKVIRNIERKIIGAGGRELTVLISLYPESDDEGNTVSYDGYFVDITERKRLEESLVQTQKMESIGLLAGGIAHDFNNILAAILGYTELALASIPDQSDTYQDMKQVLNAAHRARYLVRQILAFSRKGQAQAQEPVIIQAVVREALKLLRATLPSTIEFQQHISEESAIIMGNPTQLHQVMVNLCTNAAHAMREKGGILEVALEGITVDEASAAGDNNLQPGPYVKLSVTDTGHGMDSATIERIFDPYFTTKGVGEGSGLGLAVVHGIVKGHLGSISVHSEPGKGTVFEVFFPRIQAGVKRADDEIGLVAGGEEHILFVDDEEPLVMLVERMLLQLGYRATTTTKSIEAIKLFRAAPDAFDLVITDYTMPHMTGVDLARELLQIRSDIPIVLCTGYSDTVTEETAKNVGIRAFAMKPLSLRDIAELIRNVLASNGQLFTS